MILLRKALSTLLCTLEGKLAQEKKSTKSVSKSPVLILWKSCHEDKPSTQQHKILINFI